jgi:hypothetical protein
MRRRRGIKGVNVRGRKGREDKEQKNGTFLAEFMDKVGTGTALSKT